jgi:hypothetical protein
MGLLNKKQYQKIIPYPVAIIVVLFLFGITAYSYYYQTAETDLFRSGLAFENPDQVTLLGTAKVSSKQNLGRFLEIISELIHPTSNILIQKIYTEINNLILRC